MQKILYPLQILTNHIKTCSDVVVVEDGDESQDETLHDAQDVESEKKSNEQVNSLGILAFLAKCSWSNPVVEAKKFLRNGWLFYIIGLLSYLSRRNAP